MFDQAVSRVQKILQEHKIDGWLLSDFQKRNTVAVQFLQIPASAHLTRRMFYWIPQKGSAKKIVSAIEPHFLDAWPGEKLMYSTCKNLDQILHDTLSESKTIAMEFSEKCHIPYASLIDAGTADMVRSIGCRIVSSSGFVQAFTCILSESQLKTHYDAASVLQGAVDSAFSLIASTLVMDKTITEYEVQQHIKDFYENRGFIAEGDPICAVNEHSSDPHYSPCKEGSSIIRKGDFILIDLWCKKNENNAVYADICRVAVAAKSATTRQKEIFSIVRSAQKKTADFIKTAMASGAEVTGAQADRIARSYIENKGYGKYFIHRTGHNIYTKDHGPGAHLDSFETEDDRPLLTGTCFSIEPGIYLPSEFGVRLEYDMYLSRDKQAIITGGEQDEIVCLL